MAEPTAHNGLTEVRSLVGVPHMDVDMEAHPALVLNADCRPLSYFPLSLMPWQDAVAAVVKDTVAVVAHYDTWVRRPSTKIRLPSVVALRSYLPLRSRVAF